MVQLGEMMLGRYVYDRFGIEYGIMGGFHMLHTDSAPLVLHTMHVLIPATLALNEQPRVWALTVDILFGGSPICGPSFAPMLLSALAKKRTHALTINIIARFENIQFDAFGIYTVQAAPEPGVVMAKKEFYVGPSDSSVASISRVGGTGVGRTS